MGEYIIAFGLGIFSVGLFIFFRMVYYTYKCRKSELFCNDCKNGFTTNSYEVHFYKYCPECGKKLTYYVDYLKEMEEQAKNEENSKTEVFEEFNEMETKDGDGNEEQI